MKPIILRRRGGLLLPVLAATIITGTAAVNAASYPDTILADKPVAYFRLEEEAGSYVIDNSANPGVYMGSVNMDTSGVWPQFAQPGLGSNSVAFHGVNSQSYISVDYSPDLNPSGPFTAECWARATSFGTDWRSPVCNFGGWGDSSGWHFYQSPMDNGNTWIWVQKGGAIWVGGVPITKGKWDYLAAVFDGHTVTFYVNGVASGSADASTAPPNSGQPFCIGGDTAGNWWFDGNVDEVAIYTNALTVDQLKLHYEVGLTNFYSGPIPASITQDPAPASSFAGRPVSFVVGADGTAPLSYQWYKGNTPIPGATSDTLQFICAYEDNNATYKAAVTNLYGSATSAAATLTVTTDLTLLSSPPSISRTVGSKAAFIAVPGGALPVSYQWYKNDTLIPGATDQTLWLSNVQMADDQTAYYAHISNPWANTNSDTATLTVSPRNTDVPMTGYAKVIQADDPVAFWRLDEPEGSVMAADAIGSFDGTYDPGAGSITFGAAPGIPNETDKAIQVTGGARVSIPYALELNPHGPFTAEGWFMPTSLAADAQDYRTIFSSMGSGPTGWLLYQQPNNTLAWVVFNDNWVSSFIGDPVTTIEANTWYHIALTYDGSLFHIYVNGQHTASQPYDLFIPDRDNSSNLGWRSDNGWNPFSGTIDDVAFYNKALTLGQIQAHYAATVRLSVIRSGQNIILSWPFGTLQQGDSVTGSFTDLPSATSPSTNSIGGGAKYYRVKL